MRPQAGGAVQLQTPWTAPSAPAKTKRPRPDRSGRGPCLVADCHREVAVPMTLRGSPQKQSCVQPQA